MIYNNDYQIMFYKKIIITILFINISLFIFSESLVLSNGKVLNGKLFSINKNNIILKINNKLLSFSYDLIDYLLFNDNREKELTVIVKKNNGINEKISLIKLTKKALFYKNTKNKQIDLLLFKDIKNIKLEISSDINKNNIIEKYRINYYKDINTDIEHLIQLIIDENKFSKKISKSNENKSAIPYNYLNFNELNFYEKFWEKINSYLNNDTKNLLWNLYELYSNKEKYLNILNNAINNKDTTKTNTFNNRIIKLREEFYYRAKKITFATEILHNNY